MVEEFVSNARVLFEASAGSHVQRVANQWLIDFQLSNNAWQVALQILQQSIEQRQSSYVLIVTMQLLRFKVTHSWNQITIAERKLVREDVSKTLLEWIHAKKPSYESTDVSPSFRLGCNMIAGMIIQSYGDEWLTWKSDLDRYAQDISTNLEIIGALPSHIQLLSGDELARATVTFQDEVPTLLVVLRRELVHSTDHGAEALRCLENWGIGCIPACPDFGVSVSHLSKEQVLPSILEVIYRGEENISHAAAMLLADILASTPSDPMFDSPTLTVAVLQTTSWLLTSRDWLADHHAVDRCRSLSHVSSAIALHHSFVVLESTEHALPFLQLLLSCSWFQDIDVVQPTLEFWFFLLDPSAHNGRQLAAVQQALSFEALCELLGNVVNALIHQCRYPESFIAKESLQADDDIDVEAISALRIEVGDTLLSLFSKWPGSPSGMGTVSCVRGMTGLLQSQSRSAAGIATIDAVLYLLESMIELFDMDSSDSEGGGDDNSDGSGNAIPMNASEGAQLLQQILLIVIELPPHPLLIQGTARFFHSLTNSLVLPGDIYLRVAKSLARGLHIDSTYALSTNALLLLSKTVIQYTELSDRHELVSILMEGCHRLRPHASLQAHGDLLEASFRMIDGISDAELSNFCNSSLTGLIDQVQNNQVNVAADGILLLGRAICGIENYEQRTVIVAQVWPLLTNVIARTQSECQSIAIQDSSILFFTRAIASNPTASKESVHNMVSYCLQWFPDAVSPSILQCLSSIIATHGKQLGQIVEQIVQVTVTIVMKRTHYDMTLIGVDVQLNYDHIDAVFVHEHETEVLAPEIRELYKMLRYVVQQCPAAMLTHTFAPLLQWSWLLLEVDHQVQDICDAVAEFFIDLLGCLFLTGNVEASRQLEHTVTPLLNAVFGYIGDKSQHYKVRNIWAFLFQLLHSPRIISSIRECFCAALLSPNIQTRLQSIGLSVDQAAQVSTDLIRLNQRHRFIAVLNKLVKVA